MVRIENDCCNCKTEGYPCQGKCCRLRNSEHYYCDCCKDEVDSEDLYDYENQDLCENCLLGCIPKTYQN